MTRLALIHTVGGLIPTFKKLTDELLPGVDVYNVVDESLLQNTIRAGHLQPHTARRLAMLIEGAEEAGADAILVTCSSVGRAVEDARSLVHIPVFRVDQPMVEMAIGMGSKIGVAATLSTTLEPTAALVQTQAEAVGKSIEIITQLCEGAFEAVTSGDVDRHDEIVSQGLVDLSDKADVIILAQASMARVADALPEVAKQVPILSSPRSGVSAVAETLGVRIGPH